MSASDQEATEALPKRKIIDGGFLVLCALTLGAMGGVAWTKGGGRLFEIIAQTGGFLALLSPKILAGVFIAAAVPLLLPRDRVSAWIGRESGLRGLIVATLAGVVLPGGPLMIFSLAASMVAVRADIGAVVAFVTGWTLLGLNRTLIWEFSFLPYELVVLRYALCVPMPILAGLAARLLFRGER